LRAQNVDVPISRSESVSLSYNPIQSNPIFIVKTQLTERSRITDKHRENKHLKNIMNIENEKKVMRMPVMSTDVYTPY